MADNSRGVSSSSCEIATETGTVPKLWSPLTGLSNDEVEVWELEGMATLVVIHVMCANLITYYNRRSRSVASCMGGNGSLDGRIRIETRGNDADHQVFRPYAFCLTLNSFEPVRTSNALVLLK